MELVCENELEQEDKEELDYLFIDLAFSRWRVASGLTCRLLDPPLVGITSNVAVSTTCLAETQTAAIIVGIFRPFDALFPRRTHKLVREHQNQLAAWMGRIGKAIGSLWKDIQNIWFREPPFPASVRILISLCLTWLLVMPFFYVLIPPFLTAMSAYFLTYQELPSIPSLPKIPVQQQKIIFRTYKDIFKKATFRASMLVTLYDYVQTFRALGGFTGLNL